MSDLHLLLQGASENQSDKFVNLYKRMFGYAKPYLFRASLGMIFAIPTGMFNSVVALALKPYMDGVMVDKSIEMASYTPYALVGFAVLIGVCTYLSAYFNNWSGTKITNDLQIDLYRKLLTLESAFFDKGSSGLVLSRFAGDAGGAGNGLLGKIKEIVTKLFSALSLICVLLYNSWFLALIAVAVLLCAFIPIKFVRKKITYVSNQSVKVGGEITSHYNETFGGNKIISSYNLSKNRISSFSESIKKSFNLGMKLTKGTAWLNPLTHIIASVGIAIVLGLGNFMIVNHYITPGNFASFIAALVLLYAPVKTLGNTYVDIKGALLAMERVFVVLDYEPKIKEKENAINLPDVRNNITFENVCFEYEKETPVLKNINMDIKIGETLALVGNSGGGKSTFVNLIPRFYDVKSGAIKFDGIDVRDVKLESLRNHISIVFQDNFLFAGTIKENIALGKPNATDYEINKAVENAYLKEFIDSLDKGLDTEIGERGVLLSGGQKQRIAIARAFLKDSPIVILDEATSALDNKSEAIVQKAIEALMKDRTVFVIAHRLSTIKHADRIAVINEGQVVELGSHEELMKIKNGAYKALYDAQFKVKSHF